MENTLPALNAAGFVAHLFAQPGLLPAPQVLSYGAALSPYLHVGPDHVASPDTGEVALVPQLVALDQRAREIAGCALLTSAGYRTVHHEQQLAAKGYKTAGFVSPHSLGCALDKQMPARAGHTMADLNELVRMAYVRAAQDLGLPRPRLGHRAYGERFTHVDLVFLLFQPYTALPHPSTWLELAAPLRAALEAWRPGVEW